MLAADVFLLHQTYCPRDFFSQWQVHLCLPSPPPTLSNLIHATPFFFLSSKENKTTARILEIHSDLSSPKEAIVGEKQNKVIFLKKNEHVRRPFN